MISQQIKAPANATQKEKDAIDELARDIVFERSVNRFG
jgi:hypothetical protein